MKTLILLAFMLIINVFAGEIQEALCGNKSLSYCINHFDRQCRAKNYNACWIVGVLHGDQEQYSESKKYYEMVCDKANSKDSYETKWIDSGVSEFPVIPIMQISCHDLGEFYYKGLGVRQSYEKAFHYLKKSCDFGDGDGCNNLGVMYGNGDGVKQNLSKAKELFGKACDLGKQKGAVITIKNLKKRDIEKGFAS